MDSDDVRKGVTQANFNEQIYGIFCAELGIISVALGFFFKSWYVFGLALVGLFIMLQFKRIRLVLFLLLSLCWAITGAFIGEALGGFEGGMVVGAFAFVIGLGIHLVSMEYLNDLSDTEDRNF